MKHTIVIDEEGPQTRDELCDIIKAYTILTSCKPVALYVPLSTYQNWTQWPANEKGCEKAAGEPDPLPNMTAVPPKIMGLSIYIASAFRMC